MNALPYLHPERVQILKNMLERRILIIDGAMGTMLQSYHLDESGYRGERFVHGFDQLQLNQKSNHAHQHCDLKGNNDLLTLTQPEIIRAVHNAYLEAGADLIETNTFNSTSIAQADYHLEHLVYELNYNGASIAREVCDKKTAQTPERPRFVIGVLGPTNRTASISPDVNNPGFRNISFEELNNAYKEAAAGLIDGGSDVIMVETVFDTLNAKAALYGLAELFQERKARLPIMISGTITDMSGRTLSGQTAEAFWYSTRHAHPLAVGLNCALGANELRAHIDILSQVADCHISAHPNAGLPNVFGEYDETPDEMAATIAEFAKSGLVNFVGGCCGTTPAHIHAIDQAVASIEPRRLAA